MWDPSQWLCLRTAAFGESLLFGTWGGIGCWEAATQHLHNSWAPAQKEQGHFLKHPTNHRNGDLELEEKKGLTPLADLPCVVILCDCRREEGIPPSENNQAKDQDIEEKQVWMNVAWKKPPWAGKLLSHLFNICCGQGNRTLCIYWHCNMFINLIKKTPASVLWSLNWNNLKGLGFLSCWLNPKWGQTFGLIDLVGFMLQCR